MNTAHKSFNPATGDIIWQGCTTSNDEIDTIFKQAREAFHFWSSLTIEERSQYLINFKNYLVSKQNLFAEAISVETGKPLWESITEVSAMTNKIDISLDAYKYRCQDFDYSFPNAKSITRHRPHGIVAVFGPYNFPGHLPNGHIVPALLAGNVVIFKPSELTPFVGELMIQFWKESGLPENIINLAQGGAEVGQKIAKHRELNGLFFTGSSNTGKKLALELAQDTGKILALEMGGNNPLVFHDVKNLEAAVYLTIQSAYLTAGQRCTCARRLVVVDSPNADLFVDTLKEQVENLKIGPYTQNPEPFMGPLINKEAVVKLIQAQDDLISKGAIPLLKMKHLNTETGFVTPGLIDVTSVKNLPDVEYFGPFLQIKREKNLDAAIREANNTSYGLVAGIFTEDEKAYQQFYNEVRAGLINWNTQLTGASSSAPFGGLGSSGNFRPSALYAADYCSYPVASMENSRLKMPEKLVPGLKI